MATIKIIWKVEGVPTDADSVKLSAPDGSFGVRRVDTEAIVVADGTDMTRLSAGTYTHDLGEIAVSHEYYVEVSYLGNTTYIHGFAGADGEAPAESTVRCVVIKLGQLVALDDPPKLSNPTGSYGAIRTDTGATVVADGVSFTADGTLYSKSWTEPEPNLTYRYYVEIIHDGATYHLPRTTSYVKSAALVIGRYCTSVDIEQQYGVENIHKMLGIDESDDAIDYGLRLWRFVELAEQQIDDILRGGPYVVPFAASIPNTIRDAAATLAGVRAYEARGAIDTNPETGNPQHRYHHQAKAVEKILARIKAGELRLDVESAKRYPAIVEDD
jgi:hypothetical protein